VRDDKKIDSLRVFIAGGGTGGHLFPAIAIQEALKNASEKHRILFIGTRQGLEARLLPRLKLPVKFLWISGFTGKSLLHKLLIPLQLLVSFVQSLFLLALRRPHIVVGTGGFAAGPIVRCAQFFGIPTLLQEQNAFPGVTTKLLSKHAKRICVHFPETIARLPHPNRAIVTGNPLRAGLTNIKQKTAREFWKFESERPVLLVLGGSLGARTINRALTEALAEILNQANIIWQVGRTGLPDSADGALCDNAVQKHQLVILDFIYEMPMAYSAATLALCRAGAMTLAELALVGLPAILVPFPFAAHQHQDWNARAYETAGAAVRIADADLTGEKTVQVVSDLLNDKPRLEKMTTAMQTFAKPHASTDIANIIFELTGTS